MSTQTGFKVNLKNNLISHLLSKSQSNPDLSPRYRNPGPLGKWESLNDSRYCYWSPCLDSCCPFSEENTVIEHASMTIYPRLKKSPLDGRIEISLPRDILLALDFISGTDSTFEAIGGYLGLRSDGGIGTSELAFTKSSIESHVSFMLAKVLDAIPQAEIECRVGDMPTEILTIFIKLGKLNQSYMQALNGSQRDELFSADLGL